MKFYVVPIAQLVEQQVGGSSPLLARELIITFTIYIFVLVLLCNKRTSDVNRKATRSKTKKKKSCICSVVLF